MHDAVASPVIVGVNRSQLERTGGKMARVRRASTSGNSTSARSRKSGTGTRASRASSATSSSNGQSAATLTCPECGKTFTRAASLGAHRNRAHGVAGASSRAQRTRIGSSSASTTRRSGGGTQSGTRRRGRPRGSGGTRTGSSGAVNRDALLQALFPNGVPAREEVIRRANAWLDEAEQLAKSK